MSERPNFSFSVLRDEMISEAKAQPCSHCRRPTFFLRIEEVKAERSASTIHGNWALCLWCRGIPTDWSPTGRLIRSWYPDGGRFDG